MLAPRAASSVVTAATMPGRSTQDRVRTKVEDMGRSAIGPGAGIAGRAPPVKGRPPRSASAEPHRLAGLVRTCRRFGEFLGHQPVMPRGAGRRAAFEEGKKLMDLK